MARKRAESALDVPVSITALSAQDIERYDLSSLEKVAMTVPQLNIARASNGSAAQITMRGIGSTFTSIGIEQSVTTVVDGVYYPLGRVIDEGLLDMAQIEVLKGPQVLFFGKNSTAGVVSITTADPTDELMIRGRTAYEFKGEEALGEIIASGPLTDTLGLRVAMRFSRMWGGYVDALPVDTTYSTTDVVTGATNSYFAPAAKAGPGGKNFVGRVTLKWQPTTDFTATLKGSVNIDRKGNPAWNYVLFGCSSGFATAAPNQKCSRDFFNSMNDMPREIAKALPHAREDGKLSNDYDSYGATLNLNYTFDNLTLTSISNFHRNVNIFRIDGDYVASQLSGVWATERAAFRTFSNETRLLTDYDSPVNFMIGALYQRTKLNVTQWVALGGLENSDAPAYRNFLSWEKPSKTTGETVAVFGQIIWDVHPDIEIAPGVRYSHETKDSDLTSVYVNPALAGMYVEGNTIRADQKFTNWSPELTVTWKPHGDMMVYGAFKTGYKSGGFSNTAIQTIFSMPSDFSFEPEKVWGFEGGVKGTAFDRQLRYDLGVYYYRFKNLQVDFYNSSTASFITTNAGASTTKGIELALEYAPRQVRGLSLRSALNYNKARYRDYIAPCYGGQTIADGCTYSRFGIPHQDLSGAAPTTAPKWTASAGVGYETEVGGDFRAALSVDTRYSSSYIASSFGNPVARQPSYLTVDATARIGTIEEKWELALIGRNLTNKFIINGSADVIGTGGGTGTANGIPADVYGLVSAPRTVQLQLSWRY